MEWMEYKIAPSYGRKLAADFDWFCAPDLEMAFANARAKWPNAKSWHMVSARKKEN